MPVELAEAVRAAASEQGISVNEFMIRVCDAAIHGVPDPRVGAVRTAVREALESALARLDISPSHDHDEESELATAV